MRGTKYIRRITIQRPAQSTTETGGIKNTYADLFSCWASVIPMSRSRRLLYGETRYDEMYEVEMRTRESNVMGGDRIIYKGNNFEILSYTIDLKVNIDMAR